MSFLRQLVDEINRVRENPKSYIDRLEKYKRYFDKDRLKLPNLNYVIMTQEGAAAYDDCIKFLRTAESSSRLTPSKGLTGIADELLKIFIKDRSKYSSIDIQNIISKYGSFSGSFNRIAQCGGTTPEDIVINLLVCDGDKNRRQRESILSKTPARIGVATGEQNEYGRVSFIVLATSFENKNNSDDTESYGGPKFESPKSKEIKYPTKKEEPIKKYEPPKK